MSEYSETVETMKKVIPESRFERICLDDIWVDKAENVRHHTSYTEEDVEEMMGQIEPYGGLVQPIGVFEIEPTPENGNKKFALAYGFRRTLALQRLAETSPARFGTNIPAMILGAVDNRAQMKMIQLIENIARKGLSPIEKATSIKEAMDDPDGGVRQKDVAKMLGVSESSVTQMLKLLNFPGEIQELVHSGEITFSNARTMLDNVPPAKWAEVVNLAKRETKDAFEKHMKSYAGNIGTTSSSADDGDKKVGDGDKAAGDKGSPQRSKKLLRGQEIESTYLPFLEEKLKKADSTTAKYTEADIVKMQIDAFKTVTLESETALAKDIAPFIADKLKAEKDAEEKEKAEAAEGKFWKEQVKAVDAILSAKVDPTKPDAVRPNLNVAYATVVQAIYDKKKDNQLGTLGFTLPEDPNVSLERLMTTYAAAVAEKQKRAAAAEKARKEKEAADKAAAANAPAAATA